jgi:hypothetical protein
LLLKPRILNSSIGGWRLSYAVFGFRQLKSWHGLPAMNIESCVNPAVIPQSKTNWVSQENGGQYNKRFETDSPIVTVFGT